MNHYKNMNEMHRYPEDEDLTQEQWNDLPWTKFKVVCATEEDKKQLLLAFRHIHDADIDTGFICVNQLAHLYLDEAKDPCRIEVKPELFKD